ncbi:hypothetical protein TRAPUB_3698 [Trametes pubescens]|uniref:Uncharacterized protein n=1 Tax=Trametes pubescens TaxID=154538 RepID=A0A1M2VCY8_TRAPU|nr:hypothetical protein TRAPUB_3698 [Trametes pubescens]
MLTRPPGLPSPRLGTNGPIVSGHIPRGDAALELLALWEETDSSTWPMDADTDGGSSTRAETGSEAEPVVEVVKQELAGGAKFEFVGSTLVAASKEAIGQASQAHDLTASLVGTSEVSSTVPSSAISSVPEKASSTRDGSLELKGLLGSPEVSVLQGGPDNKAGSLNLSGSESMATGKAHKRAALPTTETVSSTAFTAPGGTQTPDESLAGFPVLTPTPTPLSFSPLTVTATSSRASESTPDLDDDPSRRTSTTSSAYTPRRSIASMEHRGGPIGQQLREAKSDRLEARIEVLAADLEILRLELAQLRGG